MKIGKNFGKSCCIERIQWAKEKVRIGKPDNDTGLTLRGNCKFCGKQLK